MPRVWPADIMCVSMQDVHDKRVTVAGLGRFGGGIEVSRWLAGQGARVRVTDRDPPEKLAGSVKKLAGLPIEFRLGEHREEDFTSADLVVTSPAIPPQNPLLLAAAAAGVPVTTEIRLFIERCPCTRILGVTGTKGKSTTTAMLGQILRTRFTTWVGGNIGGSLLDRLPQMKPSDVVVLELSSYMLEHLRPMRWSPSVSVVTMISQDHLDWHGTVDAYLDAKKNIVRFQSDRDVAVLKADDPHADAFARETRGQVVHYGSGDARPFELSLVGEHNQLNAQAAFAAAGVMGVTRDAASRALRHFEGLPHRLQVVCERGGVRYVNDSIATVPEAAVAANAGFSAGTVIQIVGGYDKRLDMRPMCRRLAQTCKAVLTIGTLGGELAEITRTAPALRAAVHECLDLPTAVALARRLASPGDVVLLSTGCASYDQFDNFEARGDAFARLAKENDQGQ
jgi:UDP-N-acetylmuramoylalanine--D-glutamate ligase